MQGIQELLNQGNHVLEESCHTQYKLYRMGNSSTDKNVQRSSFKVLLNRKALQIRKVILHLFIPASNTLTFISPFL